MSTKMTLVDAGDISIYADLAEDSVWVRGRLSYEVNRLSGLSVELTPDVLDTIARLHSERLFPHQQNSERDSQIPCDLD